MAELISSGSDLNLYFGMPSSSDGLMQSEGGTGPTNCPSGQSSVSQWLLRPTQWNQGTDSPHGGIQTFWNKNGEWIRAWSGNSSATFGTWVKTAAYGSQLVESVNSQTGAIVIPSGVTSFNGQTGAVSAQFVTSVNGSSGAVTIPAGVTSFNGASGSISAQFVSSYNGSSGAITVPVHTIYSAGGAMASATKVWMGTATTNASGQWAVNYALAGFTVAPSVQAQAISPDNTVTNAIGTSQTAPNLSAVAGAAYVGQTVSLLGLLPLKAVGAGVTIQVVAIGN